MENCLTLLLAFEWLLLQALLVLMVLMVLMVLTDLLWFFVLRQVLKILDEAFVLFLLF